jgi:hypothetical protein
VEEAGVLGEPDTSVLIGDTTIYDEMRSGGRFTLGFWWDTRQTAGVQATYFGLPAKAWKDHAHGRGHRIVARPYLDINTGEQDALLVAYPDLLDGSVDVRADTELQGAEVLLRRIAVCRPGFRMDWLGGYRFGRLLDRLEIGQLSTSPALPPSGEYDPGTIVTTTQRFDLFKSTNDFHGGELGLSARWARGCWSVRAVGKVALGGTITRTVIDGATGQSVTGQDPRTYLGGMLALPTGAGYYTDAEFAVLSELGLSLECRLTCDLRISLGYDLLHWNHVGRAGDQIDLRINPTQIPPDSLDGKRRPKFGWKTSDFWAQGLNLSVEQQF